MICTLAAAVLACACLLAACGGQDGTDVTGRSAGAAADSPSATPAASPTGTSARRGPKTWPMGYRATILDAGGTAVLHITVASPRTLPPDPYIKPARGRFLVVTVTFEALEPAQPINPYDLVALTAAGERMAPGYAPNAGPQLNYATLNTGETARGSVVFDVPRSDVVGIAYAPVGQVLGTWRL